MVSKLLKSTAVLTLLILSFVVLVDSFVCADAAAHDGEAPIECCAQCCPRHHLVPPVLNLEKTVTEARLEEFSLREGNPPSLLLVKSIFHPPKLSLV